MSEYLSQIAQRSGNTQAQEKTAMITPRQSVPTLYTLQSRSEQENIDSSSEQVEQQATFMPSVPDIERKTPGQSTVKSPSQPPEFPRPVSYFDRHLLRNKKDRSPDLQPPTPRRPERDVRNDISEVSPKKRNEPKTAPVPEIQPATPGQPVEPDTVEAVNTRQEILISASSEKRRPEQLPPPVMSTEMRMLQPEGAAPFAPKYKRSKESAPKLQIGKITIEVLPPPEPKVETRRKKEPVNRNKTSGTNYPRRNKLTFGLGQL